MRCMRISPAYFPRCAYARAAGILCPCSSGFTPADTRLRYLHLQTTSRSSDGGQRHGTGGQRRSAPRHTSDRVAAEVGRVILGKQDEIRLSFTCLLAGGHLLIETCLVSARRCWPAAGRGAGLSRPSSSSPATCCRRTFSAWPSSSRPRRAFHPARSSHVARRRDQPRHAESPGRCSKRWKSTR